MQIKTRATRISHLIIAVVLAVVLVVATPALTQELAFLQNNLELKAKLLRWEQEAPEDVKKDILILREKNENRAVVAAVRLREKGAKAKGAILALMETFPNRNIISPAGFAREAIEAIGEPAIEPLAAALKDDNMYVRREAAQALGGIKDARGIEPLIGALKDPDEGVRITAACALENIKDARAVEPLIRALGDTAGVSFAAAMTLHKTYPNWQQSGTAKSYLLTYIATLKNGDKHIREGAARAVGAFADKSTVESLIPVLEDSDGNVREAAASALVQFKDRRTIEPFLNAVKDSNARVRVAAIQVLGDLKEKRAIELLIPSLTNSVWDVRKTAREAMKKIVPDWYQSEIGENLIPMFIFALQDQDRDVLVRLDAVSFLGRMRTIEPLVKALQGDKDGFVRAAAAGALWDIGDPGTVEPLIAAMRDGDFSTRSHAALALEKITGQRFGQDADRWQSWWQEQKK